MKSMFGVSKINTDSVPASDLWKYTPALCIAYLDQEDGFITPRCENKCYFLS